MVEVGYGRGRVTSELSQLGSRWFVTVMDSLEIIAAFDLEIG